MNKYLPLLIVGAIVGAAALVLVLVYASVKNKKGIDAV